MKEVSGVTGQKNGVLEHVQSEKVFKWWDYLLFAAITVIIFLVTGFFLKHWFSFRSWETYPVNFILITLGLFSLILNYMGLGRWFFLPFMRRPKTMPVQEGLKVAVVTTFVPGEEPIELLEKSLSALKDLEYPHETWVLDEKDDQKVKKLCEELGVNYFSRMKMPRYQQDEGYFKSHTKYGNYNAWLHEIGFKNYDVLAAFDPDHIPAKTFLNYILGYFRDKKVGYVQAAPAYYNQKASFIAQGAAEETYSYFSSSQMIRYGMNYPVIIGSHNVHRMKALAEAGGFAPHHADDLLLTLHYRKLGWKGVYVPKILARGLTPEAWSGYLHQQLRWARSVMDLKFRNSKSLSHFLPLKERIINMLHGLNYLYESIIISFGIVYLIYLLFTGEILPMLHFKQWPYFLMLIGGLQLSEIFRKRFYLDWRREAGLHWRVGILKAAKWPYFLLAIWEVILNKTPEYSITRKSRGNGNNLQWFSVHYLIAMFLILTVFFTLLTGQFRSLEVYVISFIVITGFLVLPFTGNAAENKRKAVLKKKVQPRLSEENV
ncbi:MAG: glycosyltransferase [Calditrichia bacterium]